MMCVRVFPAQTSAQGYSVWSLQVVKQCKRLTRVCPEARTEAQMRQSVLPSKEIANELMQN